MRSHTIIGRAYLPSDRASCWGLLRLFPLWGRVGMSRFTTVTGLWGRVHVLHRPSCPQRRANWVTTLIHFLSLGSHLMLEDDGVMSSQTFVSPISLPFPCLSSLFLRHIEASFSYYISSTHIFFLSPRAEFLFSILDSWLMSWLISRRLGAY